MPPMPPMPDMPDMPDMPPMPRRMADTGGLPPQLPSAPVAISGGGTITLKFQDQTGKPIATDPPTTVVQLRTRGVAPNAPRMPA